MRNKFRVELKGSFYTNELYDDRGREIFDLMTAAGEADRQYGDQWFSVFNGEEGIDREFWLSQKQLLGQ